MEEKNNIEKKKNFYEEAWFMWVMLIFIAPVGIFLMWKYHDEMKKNLKIILTIIFAIVFLAAIAGAGDEETSTTSEKDSGDKATTNNKIEVADFSTYNKDDIIPWCTEKKLSCAIKSVYSDTVAEGGYVNQSVEAGKEVYANTKVIIYYSMGKEPSQEYKNAYKKAETYASKMYMSKQGIYDQLVSPYGEGFEADAAQYAIDNLAWDWNANALKKAKSYRDTMSMSKSAIYDQLISQYGEKFTTEEAQYAIDHLDD